MSSLDLELDGRMDDRRWFALLSAIRSLQGECGILLEASKLADVAWRRACLQLAEFEALRDALEDQMSRAKSLYFDSSRAASGPAALA
jgi:hypothetical protein